MAGQWPYGLHYARDFFADYGTLPVWLCVLVVSMLERRSGRPVAQAAGVVIVALIAALIWVGGDGLSMYRFFVPVMPLFALACGCAADSLWRRVDSKSREIAFGMRVIVLSALCAVGVTWATPDHQHDQYRWYEYQQSVEVPRWRQVGLWLAHHTPRTASIACVPIGAIGYYSERVVRDMVGLTDRHIASLPPDPKLTWVGHRKHDGPYILSLKPSILLLANVRVRVVAAALDDPNFGKSPDPMIFMREQDVFGPELARDYEPRIAQISNSRYLHYYARRNEP